MDYSNYGNIFSECLKICENIDDNNVSDFFPKLDNCLEISEKSGRERIIFQKSLLGLVRKCRQNFLRETKMSYKDVIEVANYFSEYIRDMLHLDGIDIASQIIDNQHHSNIEKRSNNCNTNCQPTIKLITFLILLLILTLITCLFGLCTYWICDQMKSQNGDCTLVLPKEMAENLALTCQEMGLDPGEIKILQEKSCFDKEYDNIVNKYMKKQSDSVLSTTVGGK